MFNFKVYRDEISLEEIPQQYKQETEDRRRDLVGKYAKQTKRDMKIEFSPFDRDHLWC